MISHATDDWFTRITALRKRSDECRGNKRRLAQMDDP